MRETTMGVTKPAIRRLARRGGVIESLLKFMIRLEQYLKHFWRV